MTITNEDRAISQGIAKAVDWDTATVWRLGDRYSLEKFEGARTHAVCQCVERCNGNARVQVRMAGAWSQWANIAIK